MKKLLLGLAVLLCIILKSSGTVEAQQWNSAYEYYSKCGNSANFVGTTKNNGYIYFGTRGNCSKAQIKYKTIGWKIKLQSLSGQHLQTLYFKLGGNYLRLRNTQTVAGYEYDLYSISLYSLKQRMNKSVLNSLNKGECLLIMDACMVVVKKGEKSGSIDDYGKSSGYVYTTYNGIVKAAQWSDNAKIALKSYFAKSVNGLFLDITTKKTAGIKSVSGKGKYCYGTYVTISATVKPGYQFKKWECDKGYSKIRHSFFVNKSQNWTAYATPKQLTIKLYRNANQKDKNKKSIKVSYPGKGECLRPGNWKKPGYHLSGWAWARNSKNAVYKPGHRISAKWIAANASPVKLYGVWKSNQYTIQFKGKLVKDISPIKVSYEDSMLLPENGEFLGWSLQPGSDSEVLYKASQQIMIKEIVKKAGLTNTEEGVITLYAIWESVPVVDAEDQYYSLDFAKMGKISEMEIAHRASAYDVKDGTIPYGKSSMDKSKSGNEISDQKGKEARQESTSFYILDYDSRKFTSLEKEAQIPITFQATNSMGKTARRQIMVHIVDSTIKTEYNIVNLRFISNKYFITNEGDFVNEKAGGLLENSCWKKLDDYYSILKNILNIS